MVLPADFHPPALQWKYLQSQNEKVALLQPIKHAMYKELIILNMQMIVSVYIILKTAYS